MNRRTGPIATGFVFGDQPVAAEWAWMSLARGAAYPGCTTMVPTIA
jgi:hypothetical protein